MYGPKESARRRTRREHSGPRTEHAAPDHDRRDLARSGVRTRRDGDGGAGAGRGLRNPHRAQPDPVHRADGPSAPAAGGHRPDGYGPAQLRAAYGVASIAAVQPDDDPDRRDRRRVQRPEPGRRPRRVPQLLRPAGLHDGLRMPADRRADRLDAPAGRQPGLGTGDLARCGDGLGDVPALPYRRRRSVLGHLCRSRRGRERGRQARRACGEQQLGRHGLRPRSELRQDLLRPSRGRDRRGDRRFGLPRPARSTRPARRM